MGYIHTENGKKVGDQNPMPVVILDDVPSSPTLFTLINASTVVASGTFAVAGKDSITIEIFGTATSAVVDFKCVSESGAQRALMGYRISDLETGSSGGINEIWVFDVPNLISFTVNLTSVTGGNVTVKGRAG